MIENMTENPPQRSVMTDFHHQAILTEKSTWTKAESVYEILKDIEISS
jgi:hypothetical protein